MFEICVPSVFHMCIPFVGMLAYYFFYWDNVTAKIFTETLRAFTINILSRSEFQYFAMQHKSVKNESSKNIYLV